MQMKVFQNFKHHRFDDYYARRMAEKEFQTVAKESSDFIPTLSFSHRRRNQHEI